MLSLVALPLVVSATREGLQAIPQHVREASFAVGKTKAATTRRILLPAARPSVATGAMLGFGRIIGDTAIIVVLLGATQNFEKTGSVLALQLPAGCRKHPDQLRLLQRPHGGGQPAAEGVRSRLRAAGARPVPQCGGGRRPSPIPKGRLMEFLKPPPVRRLDLEHAPEAKEAPKRRNPLTAKWKRKRQRIGPVGLLLGKPAPDRRAPALDPPHGYRRALGRLRRQARGQGGLDARPPGRGPRPDRPLRLRQDDPACAPSTGSPS